MAPDLPSRETSETPLSELPPPCCLMPSSEISTSPASTILTTAGRAAAVWVICPDFPGLKKSFFPAGRGTLRGFFVLLVISIMSKDSGE